MTIGEQVQNGVIRPTIVKTNGMWTLTHRRVIYIARTLRGLLNYEL